MRSHAGDAGVQEQACGALAALTAHADNQLRCGAAGGIPALLAVLRAHGDSAAVWEMGFWALNNLCSTHAALRAAARDAGAADVLTSALARFAASDASAQAATQARAALRKLDAP
jgi:hypothetical protein